MGYYVQDHPCLNVSYGPQVCAFRWANGLVLSSSSVIGVALNMFVMFIITRVKLPGHQNIFMFNLAVSNVILSCLGVIRGLGIIAPIFVHHEDNSRPNAFCGVYAIALNSLGQCNTISLVPLTLERFAAIVYPFHHRYIFTIKKCIMLVMLTIAVKIAYIITYVKLWYHGAVQTKFYFNYHRCTTSGAEAMFLVRYVGFTIVPFAVIILMYGIMIWKVKAEKLSSRRMLAVTFFIILTGFIAWFPSIIVNFGNINMNYEVSQILTVTLFYLNSVTDPIIYILGYPSVKRYLRCLARGDFRAGQSYMSRTSVLQSELYRPCSPLAYYVNSSLRRNSSNTIGNYRLQRLLTRQNHGLDGIPDEAEDSPSESSTTSPNFKGRFRGRSIMRRHSADSARPVSHFRRRIMTTSLTVPDIVEMQQSC